MITSGSSILIRQHYALIYNFDVRFVEICLFFSDVSENWLAEFEIRNCFRRRAQGFSLRFACKRPQGRSSPAPFFFLLLLLFSFSFLF